MRSYGKNGLNTEFVLGLTRTQERRKRRQEQRLRAPQSDEETAKRGRWARCKKNAPDRGKCETEQKIPRKWMYLSGTTLEVTLGDGPYRRQREALSKLLRARYTKEDTVNYDGMDKKFSPICSRLDV